MLKPIRFCLLNGGWFDNGACIKNNRIRLQSGTQFLICACRIIGLSNTTKKSDSLIKIFKPSAYLSRQARFLSVLIRQLTTWVRPLSGGVRVQLVPPTPLQLFIALFPRSLLHSASACFTLTNAQEKGCCWRSTGGEVWIGGNWIW